MKKILYKCKFLTDVVLSSKSATIGNSEPLDYIPGSRFLGIVASKLYDMNSIEKTLDIFHNGTIRFGDAHLLENDERSLKVPFDWFHIKGESLSDCIYLHHELIGTDELKTIVGSGKQLKQARQGYFADKQLLKTDSRFSIKSAYDSDKKRSADEQMYGYFGLKAGSEWGFYIEYENENYVRDIENELIGKKRIGRSRSAQYGLVNIKKIKEIDTAINTIEKGEITIYAESNLCFYDTTGQNNLQPTIEMLKLPEGSKILWEKSQIRSRNYQTWNRQRNNRDADRRIIEKGSVFVIDLSENISTEKFEKGIGSHLSEGFGKVLVNPDFLNSEKYTLPYSLKKAEEPKYFVESVVDDGSNDNNLINYLKQQVVKKLEVDKLDKQINEISNRGTFSGISPSQWGQIRSIAKWSANVKTLLFLLFDEKTGYLMHGQAEENWRQGDKRGLLRKEINAIPNNQKNEFVIKLASVLAKKERSKNEKDN